MMSSERCGTCSTILTFVGFTVKGERVLTCLGTLTHYEKGVGAAMVPCNPRGFVVLNREVLNSQQVKWHDRDEFRARPRSSRRAA